MITMATLTVTTASDVVDSNDTVLSLREAVTQSNGTAELDTIQFASTIEGQTLVLSGGELVISRDVTIDGDLNNDGVKVTLSGGHTDAAIEPGSLIFNIVGLAVD